MSNIIQITKDVSDVYELIEQNIDIETGEIPEELSERLDSLLAQLSDKVEAIGFGQIMKDKEIEALQEMKKSIDHRIKVTKNSKENFKKFLAPIVRKFGTPTGKNNDLTLVGPVVKIKDISRFVFETEPEAAIKDEHKLVTLTVPFKYYQDNLEEISSNENILSIDFGVDWEKMKLEYDLKFSEMNKTSVEGTDLLPMKMKKDEIKFPEIPGLRKIWKNNVSFLGLKKLEVDNGGN